MNNTKHALLISIFSILVKGNKHYCTPRPNTLRELLSKYHNIIIGRRWFFQAQHDLEEAGYIVKKRRWKRNEKKEIRSESSMFTLTVKGCQYLIRKGVSQARGLLNNIVEWLQKKDGRYPTSKDIAKEEDATDAKSALLRVKELLKDIG